jgi:PEP-CTERM motif
VTSKRFALSAAVLMASLSYQAKASSYTFEISGPGISGDITVTYGTATDSKVTQGFEVTGVSGTFSDSNHSLNIANAIITGLVPINHATPDPTNLLAPHDFSKYAASGLMDLGSMGNVLSYDNLFYPNGNSPGVATDYDYGGGILDIYGLFFKLNNGDVVNVWSNGITPFAPFSYGTAVATGPDSQDPEGLDYQSAGVQVIPEPASLTLLGGGLLTLLAWRRKR